MNPEDELMVIQQEIEQARKDLRNKEDAPLDGRVVDEDAYQASLMSLRRRLRLLEKEESRLAKELT